MDFIEGEPPNKVGHYWLRLTTTEKMPVQYSVGVYGWKCNCHADQILDLSDRLKKALECGAMKITGWLLLPDPKVSLISTQKES